MASTIASPVPRSQPRNRSLPKDLMSFQPSEEGRGTPLPQYEKTQSVPFTLTLQEEKDNPGKFQLVVNVDPQHQKAAAGSPPKPAPSKKLVATLQEAPSLGFDVSQLYQTMKSSPPTSPQDERQGWSDLDAVPPGFLKKVVPDWKVTFSRSDSTASHQSKKLADIKARIKKSGKGFVVRLLKGSSTEHDEVAEVHLGQNAQGSIPTLHELDSTHPPTELDATDANVVATDNPSSTASVPKEIFEIGSSNEPGMQRTAPVPPPARNPFVAHWLNQNRASISEEGFSDAETLLPDFRSIADRSEEQTDLDPFSRPSSVFPTRSSSVLSIVKTPTRGLSVIGPVTRIEKTNRVRPRGKTARSELNRSGAHKSLKHRSPRTSTSDIPTMGTSGSGNTRPSTLRDTSLLSPQEHSESSDDPSSNDYRTWQYPNRSLQVSSNKAKRRSSAEELAQISKPKARLRLQTDVARPKSANTSPVTRRKRSPRTQKSASTSSPFSLPNGAEQMEGSPVWDEVESSDELRKALRKAFGNVPDIGEPSPNEGPVSIPKINEPANEGETGEFLLPPEVEIRATTSSGKGPMTTFWGLTLSALSAKAFDGLKALGEMFGSEPPVPPEHVRVRWVCSCGEHLYDDFIERRPGAARWLEAYLNRPRAHTPTSPSNSRSTTHTSMSSMFDSMSRASTLATPASTFAGPSFWATDGGSSKYSPTRVLSSSPSFVRIAEESWLLTCANEGRFTPKIVHLDVNEGRIKSDKDLALTLREHYERLNRGWFKRAKLRGLSTIEFVQFEVHRNRFADIRATPSMPPRSSSTSEKSPSQHPYTFEPVELIPPVGSTYLLHLFKHPEDYDGEMITYLRSPKRRARLDIGMGWGINLVEGFLAQKVWAVVMLFFGIGSGVFAIVWTVKESDVQGAFGVAGWVVTLAALILGSLQTWLD